MEADILLVKVAIAIQFAGIILCIYMWWSEPDITEGFDDTDVD